MVQVMTHKMIIRSRSAILVTEKVKKTLTFVLVVVVMVITT
ncbi:hypothetical protein SGH10_005240 (plasmid) [Klebsiella pneumoniae]|nr:hypothetical protein SGH10_005240 [Klebsiella pneumoniae]AWM64086.1 Hypothetical protein [Klebsiella pneumoniae]QIQ13733.1 hypothetical protein [Klebsiella pneumoniae]QVQ58010.1 hypothetical protein [Klebsiella pneumoniae]URZ91696.1 hypothetical protein [Klebsiella pneumoniae]